MRPCVSEPQLCTYRDIRDGVFDLIDIADFNEQLNILYENKNLLIKKNTSKSGV